MDRRAFVKKVSTIINKELVNLEPFDRNIDVAEGTITITLGGTLLCVTEGPRNGARMRVRNRGIDYISMDTVGQHIEFLKEIHRVAKVIEFEMENSDG